MKRFAAFYVFIIIPLVTFLLSMRVIKQESAPLDNIVLPILYLGLLFGGFFGPFIFGGIKRSILFWTPLLNTALVIVITNISYLVLHDSVGKLEMGAFLLPLVFGVMIILPTIFLTLIGSAIGLYTKTKITTRSNFNG